MFWDAFMGLDGWTMALLAGSLFIALSFEFVNGFHDTANAVATVIYTRSLRARSAVGLSGVCNFLGVHIGGIAVAYAIVHLLPVDLLVSVNSSLGLAMVFALLVSAIAWNFGTWYLGLPASSSHTLIGSILGVAMANCLREGIPLAMGVNWAKATEVGLSLLISPLLGFAGAGALLLAFRKVPGFQGLNRPPQGHEPPSWGIRAVLIASGMGVSVAHGSNDGQKGVGLIMLILIGILPGVYAMNLDASPESLKATRQAAASLEAMFTAKAPQVDAAVKAGRIEMPKGKAGTFPVDCGVNYAVASAQNIQATLGDGSLAGLGPRQLWALRTDILCLSDAAKHLFLLPGATPDEAVMLEKTLEDLRGPTEYAPDWVLLAVSMALGIGTMVGWKRIVVTIGEKIGKTHMTYAQGAAAQIVAMSTIGLADVAGLPVSTTHVLSSGVAGTMAAGKSGLQFSTLRSIAMAWVLTLPAAMLLGGGLFMLFIALV